jgi:hypothetical protein
MCQALTAELQTTEQLVRVGVEPKVQASAEWMYLWNAWTRPTSGSFGHRQASPS